MVKVRSSFFSIAFQFFSALLIVALLLTNIGVFIPAKWDETITAYQTKEEVKNSFGYTYAVSAIRFIEDEENVNIEKIEKISYAHRLDNILSTEIHKEIDTFLYLIYKTEKGSDSIFLNFHETRNLQSQNYYARISEISRIDFEYALNGFLWYDAIELYTYDEYSLSVISESTIGGNVQWD